MAVFVAAAEVDAIMDYVKPDDNYGALNFVAHEAFYTGIGKAALFRGIGNFDVSGLAGLEVSSAELVREVYSLANGGQDAKISRCTRPAEWTEGGVTWNKYDGVNSWTAGGGDFDDVGPPAVIEFTEPSGVGTHRLGGLEPFVSDALANRGGIVSLITRLVDEDPGANTWYSWRSREYGSDVWRLEVEYVLDPGRRSYPVARQVGYRSARPRRPHQPRRPVVAGGPRRPRKARVR